MDPVLWIDIIEEDGEKLHFDFFQLAFYEFKNGHLTIVTKGGHIKTISNNNKAAGVYDILRQTTKAIADAANSQIARV